MVHIYQTTWQHNAEDCILSADNLRISVHLNMYFKWWDRHHYGTLLKHRQNITSPLLMIHFSFWIPAILVQFNSDVNENCKQFITWYLNFVRILMLWNKKIWYVWFVNVALHWHWWFLLCCKFPDCLKK